MDRLSQEIMARVVRDLRVEMAALKRRNDQLVQSLKRADVHECATCPALCPAGWLDRCCGCGNYACVSCADTDTLWAECRRCADSVCAECLVGRLCPDCVG